jgi:hypothetical protein
LENGLPANKIEVDLFTHVLMMPLRISTTDRTRSQTPISFAQITQHFNSSNSKWRVQNSDQPMAVNTARTDNKERQKWDALWGKLQLAQSHAYFHPFIRKFMFDAMGEVNDYRKTYQRSDLKELHVTLNGDWKGESPPVIRFDIARCELEFFQFGIAFLVVELKAKFALKLSHVQAVQDQLRRTYSPYFDGFIKETSGEEITIFNSHLPLEIRIKTTGENNELKDYSNWVASADHKIEFDRRFVQSASCGETKSKLKFGDSIPLFEFWEQILYPLTSEPTRLLNALRFVPLGDDRMQTMSYIGAADLSLIKPGDWIRLGLADDPSDNDYPYAKESLKDFESLHMMDRFWYQSTDSSTSASRIINTGFNFVWAGNSTDNYFKSETSGAFAIFRQIYLRMALLAHLQKAALTVIITKLAELSSRDYDQAAPPDFGNKKQQIDLLYREFIEFTQVYWFDEVSPQLQGVELFNMWQKHLYTRELYTNVRQQLQDLTALVNVSEQGKQTAATIKLTRYALFVGILGFSVGFFGMNFFGSDGISLKPIGIGTLDSSISIFVPILILVAFSGLVVGIGYALKILLSSKD